MQPTASVELIVFGERNSADFEGVLKDVAAAGFPAIEGGNLFAQHGKEKVRGLLGETGIAISGAHFGYGDYADPEKLKANISYTKAVESSFMMCSGVDGAGGVEGYKRSAALFNSIGKQLAAEGISFNYHNHAWEFEDLGGGVTGMQILAAETDPEFVKFNIDVFWVFYAGEDPSAFIKAHADRAGYYHFKDGKRTEVDGKRRPLFLELGHGDVDLHAAMETVLSLGNASWIVAEQDSTTLPHLESVTISRDYLKTLGV
jgi:sugar phosphate isomerase/epimerase